ncbi:MAG: cytochrome c3 family protein [Desulfitobacteriaceae bacterium]
MMRRIALLTILSLAFLFSFAAVASAALPTAGTAGPAGTPANTGTGYSAGPPVIPGAGYTSPATPSVKYDVTSPTVTSNPIHKNYSANTDACASCHATHTAVGANLLQWANTSTACMACHDGTVTTTYNVAAGQFIASDNSAVKKTSAGLFGVGTVGTNGVYSTTTPGTAAGSSHHNVTGSLTTSLAPGGSENSTIPDVNGIWSTSFSCAACHSPHGQGGNERILNADPNGIALRNKVGHADVSGAGDLTAIASGSTTYAAIKADWIKGYPYSEKTKIYVNGSQVTTGFTIDYRLGQVTFVNSPAGAVTADYIPGIRVVMTVKNKLASNESVTYTSGMNQFCGACHTDYNTSTVAGQAGSGHTLTGQYRSAYRHQVGMIWDDTVRGANALNSALKFEKEKSMTATQGKVMCLTCHYAHGTNDAFIGVGTTSDNTRSTMLKRQVNMSVCETCHQKGAASNY